MSRQFDRARAMDLLHGLVSIPSVSHQEQKASAWLVQQMHTLGYARAYVDEAGNAVGEVGSERAENVLVLLGHIDTVPGNVKIRIVNKPGEGPVLYGRGAVDAKGPLAAFVVAVANFQSSLAENDNFRVVVAGAVEEEAATSKGARHVRDRFDGVNEPVPVACVIGEPSQWHRITLGYKGRMLIELEAAQPMAHTAGPNAGVGTIAVEFWNWMWNRATDYNRERDKLFDQLMPSLRRINTTTDESMQERVVVQVGVRLPLDFDTAALGRAAVERVGQMIDADLPNLAETLRPTYVLSGPDATATIRFYGVEPAWRGQRNNALVRSFLGAIREQDPRVRPGFVSKTGTSDMNVIGPAWQCPILAYGPGDSALDHTPDEHLALDEYWQSILVLEKALHNFSNMG